MMGAATMPHDKPLPPQFEIIAVSEMKAKLAAAALADDVLHGLRGEIRSLIYTSDMTAIGFGLPQVAADGDHLLTWLLEGWPRIDVTFLSMLRLHRDECQETAGLLHAIGDRESVVQVLERHLGLVSVLID